MIDAPVKTPQQREEERLLEAIAALGGQRVSEDDIARGGRKITIPEQMTVPEARDFLDEYIQQQEEPTAFRRTFKYRPFDGAAAVERALKEVFGTSGIGKPTFTFFGKRPPQRISVQTGINDSIQVPWGEVKVPIFDGVMHLVEEDNAEWGPLFHLVIEAPRKYRLHIEALFTMVEKMLREKSIYKGKAIDGAVQPNFVDLRGVDPSKVIYSDEVETQLNANVWSLLRHTELMEEMKIPLKRSVLFEGDYGTGKTLAAFLTAQAAVENGWTFIYCRPAKDDLDTVMATARLYEPCVVFFEDVDTMASKGDSDSVTRLLDIFDGINAKGTKLLAVLTTNHPEKIHKGMVRPGRLDAVVKFGSLDEEGIEKLIRSAVPADMLADDIDWHEVYVANQDFLPAFVKEGIDRTLRYAVARLGEKPEALTTADFVEAANGLRVQWEMMQEANEGEKPDALGQALRRTVEGVFANRPLVSDDEHENPLGWKISPAGNGR